MPQVASFSISDGKATPVSHTFSNIGADQKGILWFKETSPAPAVDLAAMRLSVRQTMSYGTPANAGVSKHVALLYMPTLETASNSASGYQAVPQVAYAHTFRGEMTLPERGTAADRKDLRTLVRAFYADNIAINAIDNLLPAF